MRTGFLWKIYAGYVALIAFGAAMSGILVFQRVEADSLRDLDASLAGKAALVREIALKAFQGSVDPGIEAEFQRLGQELSTRFTAIRVDGIVLADSHEDPARMENHRERPEILQAASAGLGASSRNSATVGYTMRYVAIPVESDGRRLGFSRASLPMTYIEERLAHLRSVIVLALLSSAAAGLAVAYYIARRVARPLTEMTAMAEAMAAGQLDRQVSVNTQDESGALGHALNRMARELRDRIDAVSRERNQLQAILRGMAEGVIAVNAEEQVLHLNQSAAQLLGLSAEESLGRRIWEVTRVPKVVGSLRGAMQDEALLTDEIRIPERNRDRIIESLASPLRDGKGRVAGAVIVMHDVTDLRRLEGVRTEFVANVSHELKTPLTAIRGFVETLLDDEQMDHETRKRFLERVREQSLRLSSLVSDLLALSRLESKESDSGREALNLAEIASESARVFQPMAEEKTLSLDVSLPSSPVTVMGDKEALRRAIDNLLDNAIKYTPSGGRVSVRLLVEGTTANVDVEDTGLGIDAKDRERIFERFYRVDKARSREVGGTGLGLSIVKHVALSHGGQAFVESEPGKGSVFRIQLPLAT